MPQYMYDLSVDRVDLVNEGACSEAKIMLFKNKEGVSDMTYEQIMGRLTDDHRATVEAEVAKAKTDAQNEVAKAKEQATEAEAKMTELEAALEAEKAKCSELEKSLTEATDVAKAKPEESVEDVIKSLDPAVQAVFKSLQAKTEAAEAVVKAAQKEKAHAEAVAKAKTLANLPVAEEVLVAEIEKGISPEVMNILEAAAKATTDSEILKSLGSDKQAPVGADAWDRLESAAADIAKSRNISHAKAIDVAVKEHPDLYREYLKNGAN